MNVLDREERVPNRVNSNGASRTRPKSDDPQKYFQSVENILEYILTSQPDKAGAMVDNLIERLRDAGLNVPPVVSTPYINTIPAEQEPEYPGDLDLERRIK